VIGQEPGTLSHPQAAPTDWLRDFAVRAGRLTAEQAKAIRVVMTPRTETVVVRVTDGEWHAAETFATGRTERAVLPAVQRCLGVLLRARDA
jgi:hypothetical protein